MAKLRHNKDDSNFLRGVLYRLEVPSTLSDSDSYKRFSIFQLIYSLTGLILGLCCVIGGIILCLLGVVGDTNWTAKVMGIQSEVSDAAPGVILFIAGLFIVWITRFSIVVKNKNH
jgi:hypothetical protein